jgi:hypothetical protein
MDHHCLWTWVTWLTHISKSCLWIIALQHPLRSQDLLYLFYSSLYYPCTYLKYSILQTLLQRVFHLTACTTAVGAALGRVCSIAPCVVPGCVSSSAVCAGYRPSGFTALCDVPRRVCSIAACAVPWTCLFYSRMCCPWMCFFFSSLRWL